MVTPSSIQATLARSGKPVTRRAHTAGGYDPATGEAADSTTDSTRQAVRLEFDLQASGNGYASGTTVEIGDKRLLLDASGTVEMTDTYIFDGEEYTVVNIKTTAPAGVPLLYDLHIRKG